MTIVYSHKALYCGICMKKDTYFLFYVKILAEVCLRQKDKFMSKEVSFNKYPFEYEYIFIGY